MGMKSVQNVLGLKTSFMAGIEWISILIGRLWINAYLQEFENGRGIRQSLKVALTQIKGQRAADLVPRAPMRMVGDRCDDGREGVRGLLSHPASDRDLLARQSTRLDLSLFFEACNALSERLAFQGEHEHAVLRESARLAPNLSEPSRSIGVLEAGAGPTNITR